MSAFFRKLAFHALAACVLVKNIFKIVTAMPTFLLLKRRYILAAAAIALGASQVGAQTNLVKNGDFSSFSDWEHYAVNSLTGNATVVGSNIVPQDKYFTLLMSVNPQGELLLPIVPPPLSQTINVQPNHSYRLSFLWEGAAGYFNEYPPTSVIEEAPLLKVTFDGKVQYSNHAPIVNNNFSIVSTIMDFKVGNVTSAVLSFTTSLGDIFSYLTGLVGCIPCAAQQSFVLFDVSMIDVTQSPTLTVQKALGASGRANALDQFIVQILQGSTVVNSAANSTTTGSGSTVTSGTGTTGVTSLVAGTSYTLNEVMAPGSVSGLGQYSGALSCTNTASGGTSIPVTPGVAFAPQLGDVISCTLTNTPKAVITLNKALGGSGRIGSTDQFGVVIFDQNGAIAGTANTTGSGSTVVGGSVTVAANIGTKYMVGESMLSGSTSNVEQYAYP